MSYTRVYSRLMEDTNMATQSAMEKAAQCWCKESTKHIQMNVPLAEAFAETLDEIWSQPWLGNATTKELLAELTARLTEEQLVYRTVGHE